MSQKKRTRVATDFNSPPEILEELSLDENRDIRLLVASNPNTRAEVLFELSEEFPEAVTGNPIFDILLLENPGSRSLRLCLARSSTTSEETLARLADTGKLDDAEILGAIALNPNTPVHILEKLANWYPQDETYEQDGWFVRECVARSAKTPVSLLETLARDDGDGVREAVAKNPNTSVSILEKLAGDKHTDVLIAVAENPKTPISSLEKFATKESSSVREAAARQARASIFILEKLANDESLYVWQAVVENPKTPVSLLKKLAGKIDKELRAQVERHTIASMLEGLGCDESSKLLQAIFETWKTPETALKWLARKNDGEIRQTVLAASNIIDWMMFYPLIDF